MKTRDLARELDAAITAMTDAQRRHLVALGIQSKMLAPPLALVGVARVRVSGDSYAPDPDGGVVYVTPALVGDPASPEAIDPDCTVRFAGDLIDLVAWRDDRPGVAATRGGAASWLGAIPPQYLSPEPVPVWRSVLGWLRSGGAGLVLLSRDPVERRRVLCDCRGGIVAEDAAHARELRAILARPWPAPRVFIRRREASHAA